MQVACVIITFPAAKLKIKEKQVKYSILLYFIEYNRAKLSFQHVISVFKVINMMFYILLHATPQTHLEQAVPLYLSASWSILVGRCESIK